MTGDREEMHRFYQHWTDLSPRCASAGGASNHTLFTTKET